MTFPIFYDIKTELVKMERIVFNL